MVGTKEGNKLKERKYLCVVVCKMQGK